MRWTTPTPSCTQLLGDEVFVALGEAFVAAHPSVHRSIRWYGGELADFLTRTSPFATQPILAEVALLEWTLAEVFDARDAEALTARRAFRHRPAAWSDLAIRVSSLAAAAGFCSGIRRPSGRR